jgi:GH24 family phage-related lysozyme (muramidase)
MEKVLFVFYTGEGNWSYLLPKGWWFVGAGSTSGKTKFLKEEQFQGPKATQKKAKEYLDKLFKNLKSKGIVSIYKIRESYLP